MKPGHLKKSVTESKANFEQMRLAFETIQQEFALNCFSTTFSPTQSKIETSFVLFEVPSRAKLFSSLTLFETKTEVKIQTCTRLTWPDLNPITLHHYHLIKLMSKYFIKLNSSFRFGYFVIDQVTGSIYFRVNTNTHIGNSCITPKPLIQAIRLNFTTAYYALKYHIYKILYMINLLSRKEVNEMPLLIEKNPKMQLNYRKLNPELISHLDTIRGSIINDCKKNPNTWKQEQRALLTYPVSSESASYKATIVTPIQILSIENRRQTVTSGGFGDLSLINITYKIEGTERIIQRQIIMKEEKPLARNSQNAMRNGVRADDPQHETMRLSNEALVLKHFRLKNSESQYVAKFYDASDRNKKEHHINERAILMEYYPHKSFEHFKNKNPNISLSNKLLFLLQIANSIRYMCQEGVYHLDLKASNILIQKNFTLRVTDFGESFLKNPHPGLGMNEINYKSHFKPGRTLPYAAPELVQKPFSPDNLNDRTDIFSFGIMMGEMLFENFLVDFKKSNLSNLVQKYQTLTYKTKLSDFSVKRIGPKQLFKYLRIIALLCISPNPKDRPTHEWIVIILKEAMQHLEKMY